MKLVELAKALEAINNAQRTTVETFETIAECISVMKAMDFRQWFGEYANDNKEYILNSHNKKSVIAHRIFDEYYKNTLFGNCETMYDYNERDKMVTDFYQFLMPYVEAEITMYIDKHTLDNESLNTYSKDRLNGLTPMGNNSGWYIPSNFGVYPKFLKDDVVMTYTDILYRVIEQTDDEVRVESRSIKVTTVETINVSDIKKFILKIKD